MSSYDDSFYHIQHGGDTILVWIHVDDGVITASLERAMQDFQHILESKLSVTWDRTLHMIVGIKVKCTSLDDIIISQPFLMDKIIQKFTSAVTLSREIPIKDTNTLTSNNNNEEIINPNGYLSIVGSLNYLAVVTRPDLAFAAGFLAQFAKSPTKRHWEAVQHALGYVKAWGC